MEFNTIQYCIDNTIPCFTFNLGANKTCSIKWSDIDRTNFRSYIRQGHNGFAVITGDVFFVVDYDTKYQPGQEIYRILYEGCEAVERTPGGYHFWFRCDERTTNIRTTTGAWWGGDRIPGIDIRAAGGIIYCSPSAYNNAQGQRVEYRWDKGNLATASTMPDNVLTYLQRNLMRTNADICRSSIAGPVAGDDITTLLSCLSDDRVNNYNSWIQCGIALKNCGYPCEIWDTWSQRSYKYRYGECARKWDTFRDSDSGRGSLGRGSLYMWLKEDNHEAFISMRSRDRELCDLVLDMTNMTVAIAFYRLNPISYIYSAVNGWYYLQKNNVWRATESHDMTSIPNIFSHIYDDCTMILTTLIARSRQDEDDARSRKIRNAMRTLRSTGFLRNVTILLRDMYGREGIDEMFDADRGVFAFANCLYDTREETFREVLPEDYITFTCGYDYRVAGEEEVADALRVITDIFPDEDVREYMLRVLGSVLEGGNREETFHILTGTGANGKSTLMDVCKLVFGNYYRTLGVSYLTKDDEGKDRPMPDLVAARKARMLVTSEPEGRDKIQSGLLKLLTGGDEISCRAMYGRRVEKYVPQFKLFMMCNDIPGFSTYDGGVYRRLRIVRFNSIFVDEPVRERERRADSRLKERLPSMRWGFLELLLQRRRSGGGGADGGLSLGRMAVPQAVISTTREYMEEKDKVREWLLRMYRETGNRSDAIPVSELYREFMEDAGNDSEERVSLIRFSRDVKRCGVEEKKIDGKRYYWGIVKRT